MTLKRVWIPSPNISSRGGSGVRLVVVHTAEGARTFQDLGNFFASPSAQVSSHTGIDDTPGKIGEYVKRPDKAWTQANANPYCVSTEICGFAEWSRAEWLTHTGMISNCAEWIREECSHYGIPIKKLSANQAQSGGHGVCGHVDLGAAGGGHWDPGPGFPWDVVIDRAQGGAAPAPASPLLAALQFIGSGVEIMPDYILNDTIGKRKFAVYASGLMRELHGPEFGYLRDTLDCPVIAMESKDESERVFQYDQALRGQVKERE